MPINKEDALLGQLLQIDPNVSTVVDHMAKLPKEQAYMQAVHRGSSGFDATPFFDVGTEALDRALAQAAMQYRQQYGPPDRYPYRTIAEQAPSTGGMPPAHWWPGGR